MAQVEAVLVYRPTATGQDHPVPIGATDDPGVLRAIRDRLLEAAFEDVRLWHTIDGGVATMKSAEAERLARVLAVLVPDEELRPDLRLVKRTQETPTPGRHRARGKDTDDEQTPDTT